MTAIETLQAVGVAGATPFVTQFLLDMVPEGTSIPRAVKRLLSILVGVLLALLMHVYEFSLFPEGMELVFVVIDGAAAGAMATAGVSLAGKVLAKSGK